MSKTPARYPVGYSSPNNAFTIVEEHLSDHCVKHTYVIKCNCCGHEKKASRAQLHTRLRHAHEHCIECRQAKPKVVVSTPSSYNIAAQPDWPVPSHVKESLTNGTFNLLR